MKKINTYIFIAVFTLFAGTSVFLTIEGVTTGSEVAALEQTATNLVTEQTELRETLVRTISVSGLEEKSSELGFVKASDIIYIGGADSVASLP